MQAPCESFQNAISRFRAGLSEKQRQEFRVCSRQDITVAIKDIENRLSSQRRQRNMNRITKFLEAMTQLSKVVEVFLNVDSTVALVWGPIKFVLLAAGTWVETLDRLLDTYAEIGEVLPSLMEYERLLKGHPQLQVHLENYYCDILDFHRKALDVFSRPGWRTVFHSSWRTFTTHFGPIFSKMKRHRDLLSDEKITATIFEVQNMRESMEDKLQELARRLQELNLNNDEDGALQQRERLDKRREFVFSKLGAPDYQSDFERASRERRKTPSGDWILNDDIYKEWIDTTQMEHRTLYLNGIPGTGKTILASRIIEHLKVLQLKNHEIGLDSTVAYFFFKHSRPDKRNMKALILSLLYQFVVQDDVVLDLIYQEFLALDPQRARSTPTLCELAAKALASQRVCFLVVDGLDECSDGDLHSSRNESQGEVIDWLEAMMAPNDGIGSHSDSGDRCIHLLICGQRNGFLEERLSQYPQVQLETMLEHGGDIRAYTKAKTQQLQNETPGVTDQMRQDILDKVCSAAKGMFLYAKVVLENLLDQPSLGYVKQELKTEHFPKGLYEAYERVVIHVFENPKKRERDAAKRILGYAICAERPLMWKELQSRFCINVDENKADLDFKLSMSCKTLCGSLIEVEKDAKSIASSDDIIDLVHDTARIYLQQSGRLNIAVENANMAMFCAQYLSSKPFSFRLDESEFRENVCSGYYAFLDYASANWWKHAKRMARGRDKIQSEQALRSISVLLEPLEGSSIVAERELTMERIKAIQQRIIDLPDGDRDIEDRFSFDDVICRVRTSIESFSANDPRILGDASELYGHFSYKCSKPWCHYFTQGFGTGGRRDNHINEHERPFRCNVDGCFGQQIGFARQSECEKHNNRLHDQAPKANSQLFPSTKAMNLDMSIIRAVAKGNLAGVRKCVEAGVDVDVINPKNQDDFPLFVAAENGHLSICQYLLDQGADVNAQYKKTGKTALEAAVMQNRADITGLLINAGANTRLRNKDGKSAFDIAVNRKHSAVIFTFVTKALDHKSCEGSYCLVAIRLSMLRDPTRPKRLSDAIKSKDIDTANIFIHRGCRDLNEESDMEKSTLLLHLAIKTGCDVITQELLSSGRVDVNQVDYTGSLPLHYACTVANEALIRQLLPGTHDPDRRNDAGYTPFHFLMMHIPSLSIASMLLSSGPINLFNEAINQKTIAMVATTTTPELMDLIFRTEPLALCSPNFGVVTPLHAAAYYLRLDIVDYILSKVDTELSMPFLCLPPDWEWLGLQLCCNQTSMLRTPLFLAMYSTYHQGNPGDLSVVHCITKATVSSKKTYLSGMLGEDEQIFLRSFIPNCLNEELIIDLMKAGFSYLPWDLFTWADDGDIYFRDADGMRRTVLTHDVFLEAICTGRCRLCPVVTTNYALARNILLSGKMGPDSLDFSGVEETVMMIWTENIAEDSEGALGFDPERNMVPHEIYDGDPMGIFDLTSMADLSGMESAEETALQIVPVEGHGSLSN